MKILLFLLFFSPLLTLAQIAGKVIGKETNEPLIGAKIIVSSGEKAVTDSEGNFLLLTDKLPIQLIVSMSNYMTDTVVINKLEDVIIRLSIDAKVISTVVVSAGRRNQKIEDDSVSMEILKPALINNKGITDLEQAVDQSPGV